MQLRQRPEAPDRRALPEPSVVLEPMKVALLTGLFLLYGAWCFFVGWLHHKHRTEAKTMALNIEFMEMCNEKLRRELDGEDAE